MSQSEPAHRVGLLGWPLGHSVSPAMHNAAFAAVGLDDWRYEALPVPPDNLHEFMTNRIADGFQGFNVTIPHKQAVLDHPLIGAISPAVQAIGAANTLIAQPNGTFAAENTDWLGFASDLDAKGIAVEGQTCLILGTGGSACAVSQALWQKGAARVTMVSRRPDRHPGAAGYDALSWLAPSAGLIVNCTPLGMTPDLNSTPWPPDVPFPPGVPLYDLVYNPPVTRLMTQAQAAGSPAWNGLGMLARQAALAFELWTGVPAPLAVMEDAAAHLLSSSKE